MFKSKKSLINSSEETAIDLNNTNQHDLTLLDNQLAGARKLSFRIESTVALVQGLIDVIDRISQEVSALDEEIGHVTTEMNQYTALAEQVRASVSNLEDISHHISKETKDKGEAILNVSQETMASILLSVDETATVIGNMSGYVGHIKGMVSTIKDISEQTNLLSLNARIEAARAGEAGKSFAVVATAISKLADESANAASSIEGIATEISTGLTTVISASNQSKARVDGGIVHNQRIHDVFTEILSAIGQFDSVAKEIAQAVERQLLSLTDMAGAIDHMNKNSENMAGTSQNVLLSASDAYNSLNWLEQAASQTLIISQNLKTSFMTARGGQAQNDSMADSVHIRATRAEAITHIAGNDFNQNPADAVELTTFGLLKNSHACLLGVGNAGDVFPMVAKSWKPSDDFLTWTFTLRNDVVFHNGARLTSEDVLVTFETLLDPKLSNSNAWFLFDLVGAKEYSEGLTKKIDGIKVLDQFRIEFKLKYVYPGFLMNLAFVGLAIMQKDNLKKGEYVGCGAFIPEHIDDERLLLTRFDHYFAGPAYLSSILVYKNMPTFSSDIVAGKFDFAEIHDRSITKDLPQNADLQVHNCKQLATEYSAFNYSRNSVFSRDVAIRRALNHAFDQNAVLDYYKGGALPCKGPFPVAILNDTSLKGFKYDVAMAKSLLKSSSYKGETLHLLARKGDLSFVAQQLVKAAESLSIPVKIIAVEPATYYRPESLAQGDLITLAWKADTGEYDNFLTPLFTSSSAFSFGYRNADLQQKMDQAKQLIDPNAKRQAYEAIQLQIIEDCPWIFISHPQAQYMHKQEFAGATLNVLGHPNFDAILKK